MISFGISTLPGDEGDDAGFLDGLLARGHTAVELPFVEGFPWNERRCARFGTHAADRGIAVSVHAPYFAILTVEEEARADRSLAAVEHTMKLGRALGARIVCVHGGHVGDRAPEPLMGLVRERLERLAPKVEPLGVALGLETAGNDRSFGTLGDIALLAEEFRFVRPIVDWAHVHAKTGGGLVSKDAFAAVISFLESSFPGWMIDPLQTQFTDNLVGAHGEVKHLPYGDGTLRIGPLVEAAVDAGLRMVVISEAREQASHDAIRDELRSALDTGRRGSDAVRSVASGTVDFPDPVVAEPAGDGFRPRTRQVLRLTNLDKPFFPNGITKGDLVQYYASASQVLLPHLDRRPLSMSRYPEGWDGPSFYEKRAPSHRPGWMPTVPVPSESMGGTVDFLAADSRESLMWLANMGCIEIHPFHARAGRLDTPDWAVFDLDPAEGSTWEQVVSAARLLGVALDRLGLESRPKLSGARGIHVYVPLAPVHSFRRVRRFVEAVGRLLVRANPDDLTMEWEIPRRAGKVFVDHNRNAAGQTVASVYSVRPRPGAPVSAPITWEELDTLRNGDVHIGNLWDRLHHHGDLFSGVLGGRRRLDDVEAALGLEPGEPG